MNLTIWTWNEGDLYGAYAGAADTQMARIRIDTVPDGSPIFRLFSPFATDEEDGMEFDSLEEAKKYADMQADRWVKQFTRGWKEPMDYKCGGGAE